MRRISSLLVTLLLLGASPSEASDAGSTNPGSGSPTDPDRILTIEDMLRAGGAPKIDWKTEQRRLETLLKLHAATPVDLGDTWTDLTFRLADTQFRYGRNLSLWRGEEAEAREHFAAALETCRLLSTSYPDYEHADEVLFLLGSSYEALGQPEEAFKAFKALLKLHPQSPRVAETYLILGESFADGYQSLLAFKKTTAFKEYEYRPFALYRLAWCYRDVGEYQHAIDAMSEVAAGPARAGHPASAILQERAIHDVARFLRESEPAGARGPQ